MMQIQDNLDSFPDEEEAESITDVMSECAKEEKKKKVTKKQKRINRVGRLALRYNITQEQLTNYRGETISNGIIYKASQFIKLKCIEYKYDVDAIEGARRDDPDSIPYKREIWICLAIPGYNSTTYTIHVDKIRKNQIVFTCNCQRAVCYKKLCSHIVAVMLERGNHPDEPGLYIEGGVRKAQAHRPPEFDEEDETPIDTGIVIH